MPAVITFAPIAAQLARIVPLDEILPRDAVDVVLSEYRRNREAGEEPLPKDVEPFFGHYFAVTRAAAELLGAPGFVSLARLHDELEEEYMPGGPPQSPVYDSFAMQFVLSSVPQGIGNETPYTVLARLLKADPSRARFRELAESLASSRLDLYRVRSARDHGAELEPVRGGEALSVRLTGPFLRKDDFGLMRVLTFDGTHYVSDSPYLLQASEADWKEHLARVVARKQPAKENAKKPQKGKSKARKVDPEEILARYFKLGLSERYWFEYIMDAYAGERRGIVYLAGVPDRPNLLPHSPKYEGRAEASTPPMAELREALVRLAAKQGLLEQARREVAVVRELPDAESLELSPNEELLLAAYATLGLRSEAGTTALERFASSPEGQAARPEVRAAIQGILSGWFTVVRIERIHLDEALEVYDELRREKLVIKERAATRQLHVGDLLVGWLCKDEHGTLTLEGGVALVPVFVAASLLGVVAELRRALPPLDDESVWKQRAAELVPSLVAAILHLRENPPLPALFNTSGDPFELVTGHYRVRDPERVAEILARELEQTDDGSYTWADDAGTQLARFELSERALRVHVNSRSRLKTAQEHIEALLGDAVERSLEVHEDVEQRLRARLREKRPASEPSRPELPPEVTKQLQKLVLDKIKQTLDEPIPQFKNKTLRELARSKGGRADAVSWLRGQEQLLRTNPQLDGLDLRPLWDELGLPYQGLDTDPER